VYGTGSKNLNQLTLSVCNAGKKADSWEGTFGEGAQVTAFPRNITSDEGADLAGQFAAGLRAQLNIPWWQFWR
jgi:hypothetical protein